MDPRSEELKRNLDAVKAGLADAAVKSGRDPSTVRLVAVSKRHPPEDIRRLARLGQVDFGESYIQEALGKLETLSDLAVGWHLIGGLQTNKAKFVPGNFHLLHSLDSSKLAQVLHKRALALGTVQSVLIQVSLGGEEQKSGVEAGELDELAEEVAGLEGLKLLGLMTLPPWADDPEALRPLFARLRKLRDGLEKRLGTALPELSMGMSHDYGAAVAEGATMVRIGTSIFGQRPGA